MKQITPKLNVNYDNLLGKGSTGNVYQGNYSFNSEQKDDHQNVAIKIIPLEEVNNQVVGYLFKCQLEALKLVSNCFNKNPRASEHQKQNDHQKEAIVQLYDIIILEGNCYIVMELLEGGTLKEYIAEHKKLSQGEAIEILTKLLQAYQILKNSGIVHRDLKPDNIIFEKLNSEMEKSIPKIIDFGYCEVSGIKKPNMFYNVGSPRYMSPEALMNNNYSHKSDIWALGIIFYEMVTGTNFDKGKQVKECFKLIKEKGIPIPSSLSIKTRKLLQMMLMYDQNKRQSCQQILNLLHNNIDEENIIAQQLHPQVNQVQQELNIPYNSNNNKNNFRHSIGPFPPNQRNLHHLAPHPQKLQMKSYDRFSRNISPQDNSLVRSGALRTPRNHSIELNHNKLNAFTNYQSVMANNSPVPQYSIFNQPHKHETSYQDNNNKQVHFRPNNFRPTTRPTWNNQIDRNANQNPKTLGSSTSQGNLQRNHENLQVVRINNKIINNMETQNHQFIQKQNPRGERNTVKESKNHLSPNKFTVNISRDRIMTNPQKEHVLPFPSFIGTNNQQPAIFISGLHQNRKQEPLQTFNKEMIRFSTNNTNHNPILNNSIIHHNFLPRPEVHFSMVSPQAAHN